MKRYIDTINKNEAFEPSESIIEAPENFFFWKALPPNSYIQWGVVGVLPELKYLTNEELQEIATQKAISEFKESRELAVSQIVVTVDGMDFDGDETSQTRMARAVAASNTLTDTAMWVLANNTPAVVTALQLKQALGLAGEAQTAIWVMP